MNAAERRYRMECKLKHRRNLLKALGLQGGTLYERHRDKINHSIGYMRDGNVSHYVSCGFRKRTKNSAKHRTYGSRYNYSKHDVIQNLQVDDYDRRVDCTGFNTIDCERYDCIECSLYDEEVFKED